MSNATSVMPGGVVLDWRHARTGPPAPCVFGDGLTICRSPVKDVPCHKRCAETWITVHARDAARHCPADPRLYREGRRVMPSTSSDGFRVIYHEHICPDCGSLDIAADEIETGDGLTETALSCRDCGTAWPLACIADWAARP